MNRGTTLLIIATMLTACGSGNETPNLEAKSKSPTTPLTPPPPQPDINPDPPALPLDPPNPPDPVVESSDVTTHLIHRLYHPITQDHLLGFSASEGLNAGYTYEGIAFQLFNYPSNTRNTIRRCRTPQYEHFFSIDPNCEQMIDEGIVGYAERSPGNVATRPLLRCFRVTHLETLSSYECAIAGMIIEGTLGFVP